jgi:hypothetical protein
VGEVSLPKKSNMGLIIAAAAVLLIGGGGAIFAMSGGEEKAEVKPEATPEPALPAPTPPPVVEPQKPAASDEKPVAPVVLVTITSKPAADVYREGGLLGRTPFQVPRPTHGEPALDLLLKQDGYKDQPVRVSELTQVNLTIDLERRRSGSSSTAKPVEAKPTTPAADEEKKPKPKPAPATEVLDPWS